MSEHLVSKAPMIMTAEQIEFKGNIEEALYRQKSSQEITKAIQSSLEILNSEKMSQDLPKYQKMLIALEAISDSMPTLVDDYVDRLDESAAESTSPGTEKPINIDNSSNPSASNFHLATRLFLVANMQQERLRLMLRRLSSQSALIGSYISARGHRFGGIYNFSTTEMNGQMKLVYDVTKRPEALGESTDLDFAFFETKKFTQNSEGGFNEFESETILGGTPTMPRIITGDSEKSIPSRFKNYGIVNTEFFRYQNVRDGYNIGAKARSYSLNGIQIRTFLNQISPSFGELVSAETRFSEGATGLIVSVIADDVIPFIPNEPTSIINHIRENSHVTNVTKPVINEYAENGCEVVSTFRPILDYFTNHTTVQTSKYSTVTNRVQYGPVLFSRNNYYYGTLSTDRNRSRIYKVPRNRIDTLCGGNDRDSLRRLENDTFVTTRYQLLAGRSSYRIQLDDATKRLYPNRSAASHILLFESIPESSVVIAEQYDSGDLLHATNYATNQAAFEQIINALIE
ncbi:hypothetical protein SOPP22_13605 [Shewanella sp. OPT22]|nr:hypothetical protein SOPP22_13605 [Shewanella sp. OPT22]